MQTIFDLTDSASTHGLLLGNGDPQKASWETFLSHLSTAQEKAIAFEGDLDFVIPINEILNIPKASPVFFDSSVFSENTSTDSPIISLWEPLRLPHTLYVNLSERDLDIPVFEGSYDPQKALGLINKWLADNSGYDERSWPKLIKSMEENRTSSRRLLHD
ncbi:MAG: hypothetical protein WEC37_04545 [Anaerolineales bacterium]